MQLQWAKQSNGNWYSLSLVDIEHEYFDNLEGNYVIFTNIGTIDVGLGNIRDRLRAHRREFQNRYDYGNLKVTWAIVDPNSQGGVENYLRQRLRPETGERFSNNLPIPVNLPF